MKERSARAERLLRTFWIQGRTGAKWRNLENHDAGDAAIIALGDLAAGNRFEELRLIQAELPAHTKKTEYVQLVSVRDGQVAGTDVFGTLALSSAGPVLHRTEVAAPRLESTGTDGNGRIATGSAGSQGNRPIPPERARRDGDPPSSPSQWDLAALAHQVRAAHGPPDSNPGSGTSEPESTAPARPEAATVPPQRRRSPGRAFRMGIATSAILAIAILAAATPDVRNALAGTYHDVRAAVLPQAGLIEAIARQDALAVRAALEDGADPNMTDAAGIPALLLAARADSPASAAFLYEAGADATARLPDGRAVLHVMAIENREAPLLRLIEAGAPQDLAGSGFGCLTPLSHAAANGHLGLVAALAERGAALSPQPGCRLGPLQVATPYPKVHELLRDLAAARRTPAAIRALER